jgi:hypothetical protein
MVAPAGAAFLAGSGKTATDRVEQLLKAHLPECHETISVQAASFLGQQRPSTSSAPGSRVRILFGVTDKLEADVITEERHLLKGTGITIYDVLSPEEQECHDVLWTHFLEARRKGKKAQFNRAVLRVDGERVEP